jgi:hypothetical protein
LRWEKKCQVVFHFLGPLHHQALGQLFNNVLFHIHSFCDDLIILRSPLFCCIEERVCHAPIFWIIAFWKEHNLFIFLGVLNLTLGAQSLLSMLYRDI